MKVWGTALKTGRLRVRFSMLSLEYFFDIILRAHYGPGLGVDSASNRNEYQEYFLGGKGGRCVGLTTLPPSCADCLTIGSLNLLEPSRPVQGLPYRYQNHPAYFRTRTSLSETVNANCHPACWIFNFLARLYLCVQVLKFPTRSNYKIYYYFRYIGCLCR